MTAINIGYIGVLVGLACLAGVVIFIGDYNVQGVVIFALVLGIAAGFMLIPKLAQGEGRIFLHFLFLALGLKIAAAIYPILLRLALAMGFWCG